MAEHSITPMKALRQTADCKQCPYFFFFCWLVEFVIMLEFVLCNSINNSMYITENMRIKNCLQKLYMSEQLSDCLMIYVVVDDDDVDVL